ncbi:hypothetical protein DEDE109153_08190 [Deinococcus deserti]
MAQQNHNPAGPALVLSVSLLQGPAGDIWRRPSVLRERRRHFSQQGILCAGQDHASDHGWGQRPLLLALCLGVCWRRKGWGGE